MVGCRYRFPQSLAHPGVDLLPEEAGRALRSEMARRAVDKYLPTRRALGDGRSRPFLRVDLKGSVDEAAEYQIHDAELGTLAALAAKADLITDAYFSTDTWRVKVDILARTADGTYLPVMISNHRAAVPDARRTTTVISTSRLSLSAGVEAGFKIKHHVTDRYRLALAAEALESIGLNSGRGGVIGQDRRRAFVFDTDPLIPGLHERLAQGFANRPRRLKECATCRFWEFCEPELLTADDISLVFPGDRARDFRQRGITTVQGLIDADLGEPSKLARAWREGISLLKKVDTVDGPHADVEIDVDMEAYLDQGAYLWGCFDGENYHGFATWEELGTDAEGENFARFWQWLKDQRRQAEQQGKSFAAYCYSANGENQWLRRSARRFATIPGVPTEDEIVRFIQSEQWVDLFRSVRSQLVGTAGLGLKIVAEEAGFHWRQEGFDGEASVDARLRARHGDQQAARNLLQYNEDDTRATAWVRDWLRAGAPGVPRL